MWTFNSWNPQLACAQGIAIRELAWVGLYLHNPVTSPSTWVTYVEARPWIMAKGPEHSMASWGGRLLLKSAHWASESCLSETRFLGRQRQELSSGKPGGPPEEAGGKVKSKCHVTCCENTSKD